MSRREREQSGSARDVLTRLEGEGRRDRNVSKQSRRRKEEERNERSRASLAGAEEVDEEEEERKSKDENMDERTKWWEEKRKRSTQRGETDGRENNSCFVNMMNKKAV